MPEFVIFLHRIDAQSKRSPELIREHCEHLNRLDASGRLIAAGPFEGGGGGLVVGTFDSVAHADDFAAADPFVRSGDCRPEVRPWRWSRPENGHLGILPPQPGAAPGFLDTLRLRATIRNFVDEPIPEHTVNAVIEAAITAPSEFNLQPWRPVVCHTADQRAKLRQCCLDQPHVAGAALTVICAVDTDVFHDDAPRAVDESIAAGRIDAAEREAQIVFIRSCYRDLQARTISAIRNGTIFGHHLLIAALSMGYAGFWLGGFDEEMLRREFSLPDRFVIAGIIGIGRAAEHTPPLPRRPVSELAHLRQT
jgi:putative NAD(P)H nitroreductase